MGGLQTWLAVMGGLVLVGVVAHGSWQSRRASLGLAQDSFDPPSPAAGHEAPASDQGPPAAPEMPEDLFPGLQGLHLDKKHHKPLDHRVDSISVIHLDEAVNGQAALAAYPHSRRAGQKPFAIEGLNAETGMWEMPVAQQTYSEFRAGVLLANRQGPLNEIEYSEFVAKVEAFALSLGGHTEFADMLDAVSRARELDAFASDHDAQLQLHLRGTEDAVWSIALIHKEAHALGFIPGVVSGRMILPSEEEGSPPMLIMQIDAKAAMAEPGSQSQVHDLSLSFDVPQTQRQIFPFGMLCQVAKILAEKLGCSVVDDEGLPLNDHDLQMIGQQLQGLYDRLDARGIPAGSPSARRLFS